MWRLEPWYWSAWTKKPPDIDLRFCSCNFSAFMLPCQDIWSSVFQTPEQTFPTCLNITSTSSHEEVRTLILISLNKTATWHWWKILLSHSHQLYHCLYPCDNTWPISNKQTNNIPSLLSKILLLLVATRRLGPWYWSAWTKPPPDIDGRFCSRTRANFPAVRHSSSSHSVPLSQARRHQENQMELKIPTYLLATMYILWTVSS